MHPLFCAQVAAAIDAANESVQDLLDEGIDNVIVLIQQVPAVNKQ